MNSIYKIEAYSEAGVEEVSSYIEKMGGRCVVQGWAIVTDHSFSSEKALKLLPFISRISDSVSDSDLFFWESSLRAAA